jgi:hypothetical protein
LNLKHSVLVGWFIVFGVVSPSSSFSESAFRYPGEAYSQAKDRSFAALLAPYWLLGVSAEELKGNLSDLDFTTLSSVKDEALLFTEVRDSRNFTWLLNTTFPRRAAWLYPQDGCWIRAAFASHLAENRGEGPLKKLFIFGELTARTRNAPSGLVDWWYHVVSVYRTAAGEIRVIDPAIDPAKAMELDAWIRAVNTSNGAVEFSLCESSTYSPSDACAASQAPSWSILESDAQAYLDLEWDNLKVLQRDPTKELADQPPWIP